MEFIAASADRVSADGLRWGVDPICAVLSEHGLLIAPSTYYSDRSRTGLGQVPAGRRGAR